jgi:hypothetical protein
MNPHRHLSQEDIENLLTIHGRMNRASLAERLKARAKLSYPYPSNPFCSSDVSVELVREALEEAGYKNFRLHVSQDGIYIEPS